MTTIPLHHILLKSPLLAEDILKELNLGARFEDLAAEHSACPSGTNKGFAGHHDIDELPEAMIQAMQTYDGSSAWIGPVQTPYGSTLSAQPDKLVNFGKRLMTSVLTNISQQKSTQKNPMRPPLIRSKHPDQRL